jgi:hypothetical protein
MYNSTVELFNNGVIVDHPVHPDVAVGTIEIPSDLVPITFAPILGQHHMLKGSELQNGMVVLVEGMRGNPSSLSPEYPDRKNGYVPSEYDRQRIEETARWCMVTDLEIRGELSIFTGVYSDGTMRRRTYNAEGYSWAVIVESPVTWVHKTCGQTIGDHESGSDIPFPGAEAALTDLLGEELVGKIKNVVKERLFGNTEIVDDESQFTVNGEGWTLDELRERLLRGPESDAADNDPRD